MMLSSNRRAATVSIKRLGLPCQIAEPSGLEETNAYGKTLSDDTFSPVTTEAVVRVYGKGATNPNASRHEGGRLPADSPLLVFRHDTAAQEGFRVTYDGETYEVDAMTRYATHIEATTTLVN